MVEKILAINLTNDAVNTTETSVGVLCDTAVLESIRVLCDEIFSYWFVCIKEVLKAQEWHSAEKILRFAISSEFY